MIAFLKLIRFSNLLIIVLTQYMIRLFLLQPILSLTGMELQMSEWEFALMVLATVFIAAGGYIINDYFDVRIDNINKPEQLIIDKEIKRRSAMAAHAALSSLGVAIGIFISWRSNILLSGSALFAVAVMALWFYSASFKYQFLTGNVVVSLLTAMIPFMVALFEIPRILVTYNALLIQQQNEIHTTVTDTILIWVGAYTAAAFMLSLIREMIKDMEDVEGDIEYGCRTIPIVLGIQKAKAITFVLIILSSLGIGYIQFTQYRSKDYMSFFYFLIAVQLPLLLLFFLLFKANEKKHFHRASMLVKGIMLIGIFFLIFFRFLLAK